MTVDVYSCSPPCVVLVTGGSGFLGQHVVKLLQEKAMHVTEIRVLDIVPFVQKLDYTERVHLRQFNGSINDLDLVKKACNGVDCVIHLVALIDITMFPDTGKLLEINVKGTETILQACQITGVQRLMYCSSADVAVRRENIDGEDGDQPADPETLDTEYARTKCMAEHVVINANDSSLKTLIIRPTNIYGDGDQLSVAAALRLSAYSGSYRRVNLTLCKHQSVYVGNVAWLFVCAEIRMRKLSLDADRKSQTIERNIFIACDDSPFLKEGDFHAIFQDGCGLRREKPDVPFWLVKFGLYLIMFILSFVRYIKEVNILIGPQIVKSLDYSRRFNNDRAKSLLGYTPLYDWPESKKRSLEYYVSFIKKK